MLSVTYKVDSSNTSAMWHGLNHGEQTYINFIIFPFYSDLFSDIRFRDTGHGRNKKLNNQHSWDKPTVTFLIITLVSNQLR